MNKINELKVNSKFYGDFLVRSLTTGLTVTNKPFMDFVLSDKTGSISAKLWDISFEAQQVSAGDIVYATGTVTEWNGAPQLKIEYVEKKKGDFNVEDYVEVPPISFERMESILDEAILNIGNEEIQEIVQCVLEENRKEFFKAPAAKGMHHAMYGGLAYHTITMLTVAKSMLQIYPFLNRDLLVAGVVLHDIAKVKEMDYEWGSVKDYTVPGTLLGHIVQGTLMIERAAIECGTSQRIVEALQHMIVSHHGLAEWGSPQPPRMPEAVMLHHIDNIDAKMFMVKELIDKRNEGDFTDYSRGLNTKLFIL